ncbi:DUF4834 family protein [Flavobacterium sp. SUN052]|uniref:DUF4834 family protein n=1 Tax=Flavobacterium sp. SUN052 TaxID=3002441 RepID=UPI00237E21F4|nr:DUF4834 family protein [Flavobacterium sp. SUN052]MEC4004994.1 DUF4834 family protein [Flavobacterium sp. SUN052]
MQQASLSGLIETLFWIFFVIYALKFLARVFLPVVAKKVVEKATEQFQQQQAQRNNQNQYDNPTTSKSDKPRETKKVGDYIDYEEVD